jgi:hypothetical protein
VSDPDFAELAALALKRRVSEVRPREFSRDVGIGVVVNAMAERRRRRRALRAFLFGSALASAAVVALYFSVGLQTRAHGACAGPGCGGGVRVDGSVSERRLEHGQSVVAGQGRSTVVEFGSGTKITLRDQGELVYREDTALQRFGLVRGTAHLVVAKLSPGQRFVVDTEDAEVEVRGTVFDVAVKSGPADCPRRTAVAVTEGAVEVRSRGERRVLHPGETWLGECSGTEKPVVEATRVPAPARVAKKAPVAPLSPPGSEAVATTAEPAVKDDAAESSLNEQNDLYAAATVARKQGDGARAVALYDRLLERFPRSPLAESAAVERIRLLKRLAPERAQADARRHLARYPNGYASAELAALLGPP